MAFAVSDFDDLVRLLEEHPEWRERLRPLILGDRWEAVPDRLDRVEQLLAEIAERQATMTERQVASEARLDRIEAILNQMVGRMGNYEGTVLEWRYSQQLRNYLARYMKGISAIAVDDLPALDEAVAAGAISARDIEDVGRLDAMARGRSKEDGEEVILAVEVSRTINREDVERADQRADTLRRAGYAARGVVAGYRIGPASERLARERGLIVDLHAPPPGE